MNNCYLKRVQRSMAVQKKCDITETIKFGEI